VIHATRVLCYVVGGYVGALLVLKFAARYITRVIQRRSETERGQHVLTDEYWKQRDRSEAERLSRH